MQNKTIGERLKRTRYMKIVLCSILFFSVLFFHFHFNKESISEAHLSALQSAYISTANFNAANTSIEAQSSTNPTFNANTHTILQAELREIRMHNVMRNMNKKPHQTSADK